MENVRSLANKMDDPRTSKRTQRGYQESSIICFRCGCRSIFQTPTPPYLSLRPYRQTERKQSGGSKGSGTAVFLNNRVHWTQFHNTLLIPEEKLYQFSIMKFTWSHYSSQPQELSRLITIVVRMWFVVHYFCQHMQHSAPRESAQPTALTIHNSPNNFLSLQYNFLLRMNEVLLNWNEMTWRFALVLGAFLTNRLYTKYITQFSVNSIYFLHL